jgi:hypothetical protein
MEKAKVEETNRLRSTHPVEGETAEKASTLSRMEREGAKLVKRVYDFLEWHVSGAVPGKAREEALQQAQKFFGEVNRAFQEQTHRLQAYEKRLEATVEDMKRSVDDHVKRGLSRLDIATRTEVEALETSVQKLRKDMNKLAKSSPRKPKGATAAA